MTCPSCQTVTADGAKFCIECGAPLQLRCPECAAPHAPGQRFCAECGMALAAPAPPTVAAAAEPPVPAAACELRVVSVLFLDLVGFTSLSENRDAEDVRALLSRYFDSARTVVERHGGTVAKFIGDAVMGVWGAPLAREDDAERAVRAALELVVAVAAFGAEVGAPHLRARAGVVTGRAAAMDNTGEGTVVGDRVNTAARLQSSAEPGTVYVDAVTHGVTSAHELFAGWRMFFERLAQQSPVLVFEDLHGVRGGRDRSMKVSTPSASATLEPARRLVSNRSSAAHAGAAPAVARRRGRAGAPRGTSDRRASPRHSWPRSATSAASPTAAS